MDELEISGERYISSRRAGKEHKYHPDYIGQLVRAKKVKGQKVGRAWYVHADSLAEYLGKETPPRGPMPKIEEPEEIIVPETQEVPEVEVPTPVTPEVVIPIVELPVSEAEPIVTKIVETRRYEVKNPYLMADEKISEKNIEIKENSSPVEAQEESRQIDIKKVSSLTYVRDSEPLFPAISKNQRFSTPTAHRTMQQDARIVEKDTAVVKPNPFYRQTRRIVASGLSLIVAASMILGVVALVSSRLASIMTVEEGKPASVHYSLELPTK